MAWLNRLGRSFAILVLLTGCRPKYDSSAGDHLPAYAGIPPVAYLVEVIGAPRVKAGALLQPGQDPHTFEPKPQQILALGRAVVFFKIDMPFENMLIRKVEEGNANIRIVDVTQGIAKRAVDEPCLETHSEGEHRHPPTKSQAKETAPLSQNEGQSPIAQKMEPSAARGEPDPHVWLSPPLLKKMAFNIAATLCEIDAQHAEEYRKNLSLFNNRMDALHARIERKLAPFRGRSFFVFHPGFGYFADTYGLKQAAVETGGRAPTPRQFRALVEKARADGATAIFIQPQYDPKSAQAIADALDAKVFIIDGLRENFIADIEDIAEKIEAALKR
jgi:zinc transport system substrate-binding protein